MAGTHRRCKLYRRLVAKDQADTGVLWRAVTFRADETDTVLGMPFYVMQAVDGWSPMDCG